MTKLRLIGLFCILAGLGIALTKGYFFGIVQILLTFSLIALGAFCLFAERYIRRPSGINNDGVYQESLSSRGLIAWLMGLFLTGFYIVIYLGNDFKFTNSSGKKTSLHDLFHHHLYSWLDPLAYPLTGKAADNWFFYGTMYTIAILIFGMRMLMKYRNNRYQIIRTLSVMFFQLGFAYILPNLLKLFHQPEFYFSYFWPLKAEYLYPSTWANTYGVGVYFLAFGVAMSFVATPLLTFLYGKRWYCSWVCGCGGLAETMGDSFRQHSDKSLRAWKIERWSIHLVLSLITITTLSLWINSVSSGALFGEISHQLSKSYGFFIGAIFSGIIGVGFYPLLGSRVWCRFGCPMAAVLGMFQKWFSRFRITSNGEQCISCGNCSTYCEMGIDVRWYAQRSQNVIRSSCVGCGICAAVCPRGVLKLENGSLTSRYNLSESI